MDFTHTRLSWSRPLTSYTKVQVLLGHVLRGRRAQLRGAAHAYVNVGCGPNVAPGFLNLDYAWRPGVVCWDLRQGLPLPSASVRGVFTEHCLEHFDLPAGVELLREIHRVLMPGGIVRVVVPDAQLYLDAYAGRAGGPVPYQEGDGFEGVYTPLMSVNRAFYVQRGEPGGHWFMYDTPTLLALLERVGFSGARGVAFGVSADPRLLLDSDYRRAESLYVEATRT